MLKIQDWAIDFFTQGDYIWRILMGGRGWGKSYLTSLFALQRATVQDTRILVLREYQNSVKESTKSTMDGIIRSTPAFDSIFDPKNQEIVGLNNSKIFFKGINNSRGTDKTLRSLDKIDLVIFEEAQDVSDKSFQNFLPTIREHNAELWACLNPTRADDPIYVIANSDSDKILVRRDHWSNMPKEFWSETAELNRLTFKKMYPELYPWAYDGELLSETDNIQVLTFSWCQAAKERYDESIISGPIDIGFDVAYGKKGSDDSVVSARQGNAIIDLKVLQGNASKTSDAAIAYAMEMGASRFYYDATAVGEVVASRIEYHEEKTNLPFEVFPIHNGAGPDNPTRLYHGNKTNREQFTSKGSQMAWALRHVAQNDELMLNPEIPFFNDLVKELTQPEYREEKTGIRIYKKADMPNSPNKGSAKRSPGKFDSIRLAFGRDSEDGLSITKDTYWDDMLEMLKVA